MDSEKPSVVIVHVTGFKKFHGVPENPTETIIGKLKDYLQNKRLSKNIRLGSCTVLETAGEGALNHLYGILEASIPKASDESSKRVVWIHLGVDTTARRFSIEKQAVNEATFTCPDELGWEPKEVPICVSDGTISQVRKTSLPVDQIVNGLTKMGIRVATSTDAGQFVCNYVYYHSLKFAEQHGFGSLFVHVPSFRTIDKDKQMQFVACLLEVIASLP